MTERKRRLTRAERRERRRQMTRDMLEDFYAELRSAEPRLHIPVLTAMEILTKLMDKYGRAWPKEHT